MIKKYLTIFSLSINAASFAQTVADSTKYVFKPDTVATPQINLGKAMVQSMASLVIVIVVLVAFVWAIKWFQNKTRMTSSGIQALKILESLPLGPKKGLYLVKVLDRTILVGTSDTSVDMLLELSEEESQKLKESENNKFGKILGDKLTHLTMKKDNREKK